MTQIMKLNNVIDVTDKKYRIIDLFAGIGGIRTGFEKVFKSECSVVFSSEIDKNAQKTYYLNYKEVPYGDITTIKEEDVPEHDIVLAGFPCQAFSIAGYRKGFDDTRGTLFFDVARIVRYHKPKVLFLENVKGFVGHDKGNTFKVVINTLEELGYKVYSEVLNTKDYGIPQNRERIYIVAFLDNSIDFEFPKKVKLKTTIHKYFEKEVDDVFYYNNKPLYEKIKDDVVSKDTVYQWRRQYVRENKNNVCPTLTANMGTGGHNVPIIKDNNGIRKLTPTECIRFQGFDDTFKFPKELAMSHRYKQAGNSVTVTVISAIAKEIKKALNG
ncbi:DNA cytosine methyltransferase [Sulfurimonas sp. SAG-AH-194-L11]|nr:DNA cytosine methyltransferase [Sulfurimonas sp. SAG-AH-194-L11]MDF1876632.1 DNA cytosine methyltransferase [Sulfurimonas sp. SAG-AH-194-L11]